jgi:hypothetical protein
VTKALGLPLDERLKNFTDIPYTVAFVMRKRLQIDNLHELPKDKIPPDSIIWDGSPEDLEDWLDDVLDIKKKGVTTLAGSSTIIDLDEVEK